MRNVTVAVLFLGVICVGMTRADENETIAARENAGSDAPSAKTIVYLVRNYPADLLARTLDEFLQDTDSRVVSDGLSNVLLIETSDDDQQRVLAVLQQLDRAPHVLRIQLHLLKATGNGLEEAEAASLSGPADDVLQSIKRLELAGRVNVANRIELTTIENQKAMIQLGETVPVVTGSTFAPGRGASNNYQHLDVGTLFSFEARVAGESEIVMVLDFEKSEVSRPQPTSEGQPQSAVQGVSRLTHQTTSRIRAGHSLLVATLLDHAANEGGEAYLVLSASINEFAKSQPAGAAQTISRTPSLKPDVDDRYLQYYARLVEKYDLNGDDVLDAQERTRMSKDCSAADTNEDGLVTVEELAKWSLMNLKHD